MTTDSRTTHPQRPRPRVGATAALVAAAVFVAALGVRLAYRADYADRFAEIMPAQTFISHRRAEAMLGGKGILVWEDADPSKLKQIRRPPGYSVLLAASYLITGPDLRRAQVTQSLLDAAAAAALALVGAWLLGPLAGAVSGALYALSPHQAFYATIVTPDLPVAWPVFAGAVAFIWALRTRGRAGIGASAGAGLLFGISCWLTAQGMTLPLVFGALALAATPRGGRGHALRCSAVCALAAAAAILPLTVRNAAIYGTLAPVRPGLGTTLLEGIGVYDPAYPATDEALLADEAARFGRPDYGEALYQPDGALRERDRLRRALEVIAARPLWFAGAMLDRLGLIFSYDHEGSPPWPRNTAVVAPLQPGAGGELARPLRWPVYLAQSALFRTWLVRLLALAGAVWICGSGRWRLAALLAAVPLHHALVGSLVLAEYKYALPIHAWVFLFVGAAAAGLQALATRGLHACRA